MKKWLYSINGIVHEPVSEAKITDMILQGILDTDSSLQDPESQQWIHIRDISSIMNSVHKPALNLKFHEPSMEQMLEGDAGLPVFYHVSIPVFMILMIASFGVYSIYWFYANWQYIFYSDKSKRGKAGNRSALNYLFIGSLLHKIRNDKMMMAEPQGKFDPGAISFKIYVLILISFFPPFINLPVGWGILKMVFALMLGAGFAYILLPVQRKINIVNEKLGRSYSSLRLLFFLVVAYTLVIWFRMISAL
ncbi:MAG: hypothetical protein CVU48_00830 [Candidatus Cloacimonetes bacterium HGW-Cloacimonetes-1]|jgi:hypothetical protein|nr:MAG: hypothetical protein CVU48_00830 [Candidatus Cloacimonetes bacterium HGW-Cloacimonetes-1]